MRLIGGHKPCVIHFYHCALFSYGSPVALFFIRIQAHSSRRKIPLLLLPTVTPVRSLAFIQIMSPVCSLISVSMTFSARPLALLLSIHGNLFFKTVWMFHVHISVRARHSLSFFAKIYNFPIVEFLFSLRGRGGFFQSIYSPSTGFASLRKKVLSLVR